MTEKDITKIKVGKFDISITGIKQVMTELSLSHADKQDAEIAAMMLERLSHDNYIPSGAEEEYGRAFVRELRIFTGQPYQDEPPRGLEIKVLGMGCPQCHRLTQTMMELLTELGFPADLDHVTDIKEIAEYGVMGSPGLVINGRIMAVGTVPSRKKLKEWLIDANQLRAGGKA
jgi:small redox-active disulfide protein 2